MVQIGVPGVTLKDLIEGGIIESGAPVFSPVNDIIGHIDDTGSIFITINGKQKNFSSPSGAAKAIEKKSLNGWLYLKLLDNESNIIRNLSFFRDKYMERLL